MKKSVTLIFAILMMIGVYSCSDENIGSSLTDTKSEIIEDSSFVMTGPNSWAKSLALVMASFQATWCAS